MKLFFSGIGGIGMSALAQLCLNKGSQVSGSDLSQGEITEHLEALGVKIFPEQKPENIDKNLDLLVYSEAIPTRHPERVAAQTLGIPQKSYFEYLGEISKDLRTIAIAGTHGKTTTTAMIGEALVKSGFDATVVVGSRAKGLRNNNFHAGSNEYLVVEACEYRNNFQYLHPEIVVLTNLEWDHPDSFPDEASYLAAFKNFCAKAKTVIYHEGDEKVRSILSPSSYQLAVTSDQLSEIQLKVPGKHNRENAALALAVGKHLLSTIDYQLSTSVDRRSVDPLIVEFKSALQNFSGTARRQEYLGEYRGHPVYDDYGHHPTEITATLQAFSEGFPDQAIALIFQPHQASRTRHFIPDFRAALSKADHLGLFPIYYTRDTQADIEAVSLQDLASEKDTLIKSPEDLSAFISRLPEKTILLFMGAGDISLKIRNFLDHRTF